MLGVGCPSCGAEHIVGIEVRGVYDGVLINRCVDCTHMWPRFSQENWERLHKKALDIIIEWEKSEDDV
jgi:hypothetical protein